MVVVGWRHLATKTLFGQCIVIGSAKIGNGTVVIESEISGASARDVSDETGPTFSLVVAVQFSGLQRALGPLVSGLEGGL